MMKYGIRRIARILTTALAVCTATAQAEDLRIHYAEPIEIHTERPSGRARIQQLPREPAAANTGTTFTFDAYGKRFVMELQSNRRLLAAMPAKTRTALERHQIYRGRLQNLAGSWVRLMQINGELEGAIWDGRELYTITAARRALPHLDAPIAASGATPIIYRLSDAQSSALNHICKTALPASGQTGAPSRQNALSAYQTMLAELESNTALAQVAQLRGQIDIALLGDPQFSSLVFADTQAEMVARMNIVDGIFVEQFKIVLAVPEIRLFNATNNPFTTNDSSALLDQLADYRNDTRNNLRNHGLVHLMTGRDLNESVVGVAFMGALCEPKYGAGLSEGRHGTTMSALIAAHEIGHNFGAPHDGEAGSPCQSTPPHAYLMAPNVNGTNRFSACSKQQMEPYIAAASCLKPADVADAAVEIVPREIHPITGRTFDIPIEVTSIGTKTVDNVVISVPTGDRYFTFESATITNSADNTVADGTCTWSNGTATCQLGSLPAGTARHIVLRLRTADRLGFENIAAYLTANNDRFSDNNKSSTTQLIIDPAIDVSVTASPQAISGTAGQSLELTATIASNGVDPAMNVNASFSASYTLIESATIEGGTCTVGTNGYLTCSVDGIPGGAMRRMRIRFQTTRGGSLSASIRVFADYDGRVTNNFVTIPISIVPFRDAAVQISDGVLNVAPQQSFNYTAAVASVGAASVDGMILYVSASDSLAIESLSITGTSCSKTDNYFMCQLGTFPSGTVRQISLQLRASQQWGDIRFTLSGEQDDYSGNNNGSATVRVGTLHEISISALALPPSGYDTEQSTLTYTLGSLGLSAATNITTTLQAPDGITLLGATINGQACAVAARSITCTLASLSAGTQAAISTIFRGDIPGDFEVSATAYADDDANINNNAATGTIHVKPYTDVRLTMSTQHFDLKVGDTFTVTMNAIADRHPVSNVTITASVPGATLVEGTSSPSGVTCTNGTPITCSFTALTANSSTRIDLRMRASTTSATANITASINAPSDAQYNNNFAGNNTLSIVSPPPPPSENRNDSGGGGGMFDILMIGALLWQLGLLGSRKHDVFGESTKTLN